MNTVLSISAVLQSDSITHIYGQGSLGDCCLWGSTGSDTTEAP